ncbi:ArpU family phage packaging/lysis transcriptional regulator [Paenibacillus dendritiformis]|uniref:ArpU family phage packaging/lysis transcriptional regulator n=1 Tax=Paenibacillus dendritiformis TaxID=130049 RepID=UPI001F550943|nr:ArpU family phage packaging/lysis transcriptional regulator [Paenibacillus dendritiformis]
MNQTENNRVITSAIPEMGHGSITYETQEDGTKQLRDNLSRLWCTCGKPATKYTFGNQSPYDFQCMECAGGEETEIKKREREGTEKGGVGQLTMFSLDENETWRKVEERLESAMLYKRFGFIRREAKVTASYSDMPRSCTNVTSDQTADLSIYNVDREERLQREYEQVMRAVGQLSDTQREIIERRYLTDEGVTDINVYVEMGMPERSYYLAKSKAMHRLAFALRLEVYKEP